MNCLVLGGQGFIGTHLVDALLLNGHNVRCFDRNNILSVRQEHLSHDNFEFVGGDLFSDVDVASAVAGCDMCFHLISTTVPSTSNDDIFFDAESNILGTLRFLTQAVKVGLKKVVFLSSGGTVYGIPQEIPIKETHPTNPICAYGISKLTIEKYFALFYKLHGLDYTIFRLANPFGERQRIHAKQGSIAVFLGKALRGEAIEIWGDGAVVRDYIYIGDVISALMLSLNSNSHEHIFNIGYGVGHSVNEVVDAIETVINKKVIRNYTERRLFDVPVNVLCIENAKNELQWSPEVSFINGLTRVSNWIQSALLQGDKKA